MRSIFSKLYSAPVRPLVAAKVVLAVLLVSGCATVRAPLTSLDDPFPQAPGSAVEPHLELWLEDSAQTRPKDKDDATREARAVLEEVSARQAIAPHAQGAAAPLLVVREQAIARTDSLRQQQVVAKFGLVAGVVVGAVVIATAASHAQVEGPRHASGSPPHGTSGPHPIAVPVGAPLPPLASRAVPPGAGPGPLRGVHGTRFARAEPDVYIELDEPWLEPQQGFAYAAASDDEVPPDAEEPAPPPPLELPALPPLPLDDRGFFSGDLTRLSLDLLDQRSGQLLWSAQVENDSDPRDRDALGKLFTQALAQQAWASASR